MKKLSPENPKYLKWLQIKPFICALIISIFFSLWCICTVGVLFLSPSEYPNLYPAYMVLGFCSFILCLLTFVYNVYEFSLIKHKIITIVIEFAILVLAWMPSYFLWAKILNFATEFLNPLFP